LSVQRAKKRDFANLFTSLSSREKHEFLNETLQGQKTVFDLTFGNGNVSNNLLEQNHKVLALNNNKSSIQQIEDLKRKNSNFVGLNGKLSDLPSLLVKDNLAEWTESCSAVVVQFGPSPEHLKLGRGLDNSLDEPLDLRMGDEKGPTAANLLEFLGLNELVSILSKYGAVHSAKEIAISIIEQRYLNNIIKVSFFIL
jgi:16S rRNA (cytosine1402-N4)-methyltransferase